MNLANADGYLSGQKRQLFCHSQQEGECFRDLKVLLKRDQTHGSSSGNVAAHYFK